MVASSGSSRNHMFSYDDQMTELIFDYCRRRLSLDPVPLDFKGDKEKLESVLVGLLGAEGHAPSEVLAVFEEHVARAVVSCDSPRFLAFIPAAPTKASLLFDMVVSCSSLQGSSWLEAGGAVAAENQLIRLLADLAGMPPESGGVFVAGGSAANLSALAVAREFGGSGRSRGASRHAGSSEEGRITPQRRKSRDGSRRIVAVSDQAHSSVLNTIDLLAMDALVVPSNDHRLTGHSLRSALDTSPDAEAVVAVAATAGTTNAGIVDDLAGIAEVAEESDLWFHVDAAYGGAVLFAPGARHLLGGIERADSFVVDPHKWLFAPFDCAGLLYREPSLAKAVHTQHASYLDPTHEGSEWNPSDYAYHLTRRARGLAMWFSVAVHGTGAYGRAVESVLHTARSAAARITSVEHLELVREPELSIVLFRRRGWTESDYYRWSAKLLAEQIGFVTPTSWEGETVARLAFLHPDTTMEIVDEILETMA
jgi:aromatic-L-amino-acid/L-tryptophan decarboxylase